LAFEARRIESDRHLGSRERQAAEKRAAAAARKAQRQEDDRAAYYRANPTLPSNGREPPPDWKPAPARPFVIPPGINKG
jgi:hypothetical protein